MQNWTPIGEAAIIWGLPLKTIRRLVPYIESVTIGGKLFVPHDRPEPFKKNCSTCQTEFETYDPEEVWCSERCRKIAYEAPQAEKIISNRRGLSWLPGYFEKLCLNCNRIFMPKAFWTKCCSEECGRRLQKKMGAKKGSTRWCPQCGQIKSDDQFTLTGHGLCTECFEQWEKGSSRRGPYKRRVISRETLEE